VGRRSRQDVQETIVEVIRLDRREPYALETIDLGERGQQAGQIEPGLPVAVQPDVDPGDDEFPQALADSTTRLVEHRVHRARARGSPYLRDDAVRARERASVLDLEIGSTTERGRRPSIASATTQGLEDVHGRVGCPL
jgi:hypothetical protein